MEIDGVEVDKIETSYNMIFYVPKKELFVMKKFLKFNPYQNANLVYTKKILNNTARTVLDVGCNIGMNAIAYSKFSKMVYSFEPSTLNCLLTQKNIEVNNADATKIKLYQIAVGNKKEEVSFNENFEHTGISTVKYSDAVLKNTRVITVQMDKLDNYKFKEVDFLKIDVEGYEKEVLLGSIKTIISNRPIVEVETLEKFSKRYNYDINFIYEFFVKIKDYIVTDNTGKYLPITHHIIGKKDRFFIPKERIKDKTVYDFH